MSWLVDAFWGVVGPGPDGYAMELSSSLLQGGIPPEVILAAYENGVLEGRLTPDTLIGARLVVYTYEAQRIGMAMRAVESDDTESAVIG